jgi:protein-disulfide isomerase
MKETKKGSSGIPVVIIVLVLVVVAAGAFLFYRQSQTTPTKSNSAVTTNTAAPNQKPTLDMASAPPGAQPPNMLGSPTATVTMEEFADFQCGSCGAAHPVIKDVLSAYAGNKNFRFTFRDFPLVSVHDKAYDAAVAAEAAGLQGSSKFWQMHDQLFSNQQVWSVNPNYRDIFTDYAQKIGLDVDKFKADMSGMQAKTRVDQDMARGKALGFSSTPTIIINGKIIPYNEVTSSGLRRIIDAELAAAPQTAAAAVNSSANTK